MNKTILILGGEEDDHAIHMLAHLRKQGHDARLLDSRWFPGQMTLSFDPQTGEGHMHLPSGGRLSLDSVHSVYWRAYYGVLPPALPDPEQAWIAENDARSLFETLLMLCPARWVNGWEGFSLHQTKPVQLARVAQLGLPVPRTLISNDPRDVKRFVASTPRAIIKPVQGGDHTQRLSPEHLRDEQLQNLALSPITLQAEVPGTNVRVFVAGDQVHACEVRTAELDYREDPEPELLVHALPEQVSTLSRQIARALSLLWTGIDFRLTPEGQYVFLEANPSPMFLGFEAQTHLPLTQSLADLLIGERP